MPGPRSTRLLVHFALSLPALAACSVTGSEPDVSAQEAAHTASDVTLDTFPWIWANDTLEEMLPHAMPEEQFVPLEHPLSRRMAFWVDTLDAALRAQLPKEFSGVPSPKVILGADPFPNAFCRGIPVRWAIPARADYAEYAQPGQIPTFFLMPTGAVMDLRFTGMGTLDRPATAESIAQYVSAFNRDSASCKLSGRDGSIRFDVDCYTETLPVLSATSFAFIATSRFITLSVGLLATLSEEEVVAVLAHELGHYYRGHNTLASDRLNYFYELGDASNGDVPTPAAAYLAATNTARTKIQKAFFGPVGYSRENALMKAKHLGFYTSEQEADEMALELLARTGIDPAVGIRMVLGNHAAVEKLNPGAADPDAIDAATCAALAAKDFRDEAGNEVSVPVGDLADPHHSFCFRAWNLARELRVHRYTVTGTVPTPPGGAWADLFR
jgi:hypothetical protein